MRAGIAALPFLFFSPTSQANDLTWRDLGAFAAGVASTFIAHEGGHEIAGGERVDWNGPNWRCNQECNESRIAASGFVAEISSAEVLARAFDASTPRQRAFRLGVRLSTGLHLIAYAAQGRGDLESFDDDDRRRARAILLVAGAYNLIEAARVYK